MISKLYRFDITKSDIVPTSCWVTHWWEDWDPLSRLKIQYPDWTKQQWVFLSLRYSARWSLAFLGHVYKQSLCSSNILFDEIGPSALYFSHYYFFNCAVFFLRYITNFAVYFSCDILHFWIERICWKTYTDFEITLIFFFFFFVLWNIKLFHVMSFYSFFFK